MSSRRSRSPEGQKIINFKNRTSKDEMCRAFSLDFKNKLHSKLKKYSDTDKMNFADFMDINNRIIDELLVEKISGFYDAIENLQLELKEKPNNSDEVFARQMKEYFSHLKINESKSIFD